MKFSDRDLLILSRAQYQADTTASELAQELSVQEHTVRRALSRFRDSGVTRRLPYINWYPLGYSEYNCFISLSNDVGHVRHLIEKRLTETDRLTWIVELGGRFHFAIGIAARNSEEAVRQFEHISELLELEIHEKSWVERIKWSYFGVRHLSPSLAQDTCIDVGIRDTFSSFDDLDHRLLKSFCASPDGNIAQIARELSESAPTIRHRLQRLKEKNVLLGCALGIDPRFFSKLRYRIFLYGKRVDEALRIKLKKWSQAKREVLTLVSTLGAWDFELRVETFDGQAANDIAAELNGAFGKHLSRVEVVSEFRYLKLETYPFGGERSPHI